MTDQEIKEEFKEFWGNRIIGTPSGEDKLVFVDTDNKLEIPRLLNFILKVAKEAETKYSTKTGGMVSLDWHKKQVLESRQEAIREAGKWIVHEVHDYSGRTTTNEKLYWAKVRLRVTQKNI